MKQGKKKMGLLERAMLEMVAVDLGYAVASLADLVKVRMQMEEGENCRVCLRE